MPGRSLTPPDVRAAKRAAMIAERARARDRANAIGARLNAICLRIIRAVGAGDDVAHASASHGIAAGVFWDALSQSPDLCVAYEKSLRNRGAIYGEQPAALADDSLRDPVAFYTDKHGIKRIDPAFVQLQKLRVNARQWDAERLRPDLYAPPSTASQRGPTTINVTVQRFVVGKDQRASIDANADDDATAAIDAHAAKQSERS